MAPDGSPILPRAADGPEVVPLRVATGLSRSDRNPNRLLPSRCTVIIGTDKAELVGAECSLVGLIRETSEEVALTGRETHEVHLIST